MKRVDVIWALDDFDKEIIQLSAAGNNSKKIAEKTNRSFRTIQNRIDKMKVEYECKTIAQLCIQLVHVKKLVLLNPIVHFHKNGLDN